MSLQALVLAGGKGTRLRPYTTVLPKPLMPIGDVPILEIILRQLKHSGVTQVILAVGYMSQLFQNFFAEGERLGIDISYSFEEKPLGTAGAIGLNMDRLENDFIVMNGDLLTTIDYRSLFEQHVRRGASATIAVHAREVDIDYGVVDYNSNGALVGYREKPKLAFDVSMGINVINKKALTSIFTPGEYLDIPDLMQRLSDSGKIVDCARQDCQWLDIGRVDDYQMAVETFEKDRSLFLPGV